MNDDILTSTPLSSAGETNMQDLTPTITPLEYDHQKMALSPTPPPRMEMTTNNGGRRDKGEGKTRRRMMLYPPPPPPFHAFFND